VKCSEQSRVRSRGVIESVEGSEQWRVQSIGWFGAKEGSEQRRVRGSGRVRNRGGDWSYGRVGSSEGLGVWES
jgi:hypothetical protein